MSQKRWKAIELNYIVELFTRHQTQCQVISLNPQKYRDLVIIIFIATDEKVDFKN